MIILRKKQLILMSCGILLAIGIFCLQTSNEDTSIPTVTLPVSNKIIVLDAGHGIPDEGAQSTSRNNRGRNQFKDCPKSTKSFRAIW